MSHALSLLMLAVCLLVFECGARAQEPVTEQPAEQEKSTTQNTVVEETKSGDSDAAVRESGDSAGTSPTGPGTVLPNGKDRAPATAEGQSSAKGSVGQPGQQGDPPGSSGPEGKPSDKPDEVASEVLQSSDARRPAVNQQTEDQTKNRPEQQIEGHLSDPQKGQTAPGMQNALVGNDNRNSEIQTPTPKRKESPIKQVVDTTTQNDNELKNLHAPRTQPSSDKASENARGVEKMLSKAEPVHTDTKTVQTDSVQAPLNPTHKPGKKVVTHLSATTHTESINPASKPLTVPSKGVYTTVDFTTETEMTENLPSPELHKVTLPEPTTPLPTVSHALPLHNSVDKTDGILCSSSLFALAALATLAVAAAAPAH